MYILLIVVSVIVGLLFLVLLLASMKPATFRLERSATINAHPERVFPLINEFQKWQLWSPFEKLDPQLKRTYSGPTFGVGTVYEWEGNRNAGQGRMEIKESVTGRKVKIDLQFLKPFQCTNTAEFTITPVANGSEVTWAMYGKNLFVMKVASVFCDMHKVLAKDFDRGLASMKSVAEGGQS